MSEPPATGFAPDLKAQRKRLGLSQAKLAAILEVDQSTVSMWEAGNTKPISLAQRIIVQTLAAMQPS